MSGSIFLLAWFAGVASWFVAVAEWLLAWRFAPFVFDLGIPVLKDTLSVPLPAHSIGIVSKTETGKFMLLDSRTCLFRSAQPLIGLTLHTPFPIRGVIRWGPAGATVVGRIPIGTTAFLGAWLIGWTAGGIGVSAAQAQLGVPFTLLGWAFAAAMIGFSMPIELRRTRRLLGELTAALAQASV